MTGKDAMGVRARQDPLRERYTEAREEAVITD